MRSIAHLCAIIPLIYFTMVPVAPAFAGWFGPSSYEDCILEAMKGVTSDKAAREIKEACIEKFAKKPTKQEEAEYARQREIDAIRPLSSSEIAGIKITEIDIHPRSNGGYWVDANIYNGNSSLHVCSITYSYRPKKGKDWSNSYRWVFQGSGVFAPLATSRVRFETTTEHSKAIKKNGIEYQYLDATGTASHPEAYLRCK